MLRYNEEDSNSVGRPFISLVNALSYRNRLKALMLLKRFPSDLRSMRLIRNGFYAQLSELILVCLG